MSWLMALRRRDGGRERGDALPSTRHVDVIVPAQVSVILSAALLAPREHCHTSREFSPVIPCGFLDNQKIAAHFKRCARSYS
jgi:hypothetical protein